MICETCGHWYNNQFCEILWYPAGDNCYLHANWSILSLEKKDDVDV